ncbi:hypothetical protein RHSIM_Rhsim01G0168700 [Rhododendron simsii]|uniref:Uncharacterized protein n=1 Tax=Rhododendron simsii TaxID=118357 RepID=A0A834HM57_RHOSS|nr:hypothetical protein RHSIM_Rhsim01G0168700 [Rhododendron simsii]
MASKKCFFNSVRGKGKAKEVQWNEVPELLDGTAPREAMKEAVTHSNSSPQSKKRAPTSKPTARTSTFDVLANDAMLAAKADHIDNFQDDAHVKYDAYQQQLAQSYNKNDGARPFSVDDLVLRQVIQKKDLKKFMPKWEGPFRVVKKVGYGSHEFSKMDGTTIPNHWNTQRLRKSYG